MIINNLFQESADSQPDRTKHIVMVTVTDPNSTAVTQRKEPIQRRAVVSAVDQASAIDTAINFYKKQGYRVQDHHFVGSKDVDEGIVGDLAYKAGYGVGKVAGRGVAGYNAGKASNQPAQTPAQKQTSAQTVTNPSGPTLATGKRPDAFAAKRAAAAKAAQDNMSPVTKSAPATPSPEEIRKAKQAAAIATFNMMGRGQTPNAPVDQLLQRRLAKQQGLKEGEEFGAYYSEQVAQQIFDKRQDISSEEEVLNQAYHIVSNDQGQKSAKYMFNYDEDFSGDVVSNYFHLQKQSVAEGYSGADDTDTVGFSVNSEQAYNAVMAKFGDYIDNDETSGMMYVPASIWPKVEMVAFDADGEGAVQDDGHESMSEGVTEAGPYGSRNPDTMSANNYDRYQQDQMDYNKRDFKRREHEAEWEQEKAYSAKLAAQQAGPWYVRIDGKIVKDRQGNPYTFNSKAAVNKAALTMQAKTFNQGKKVMLTTNPNDTPSEGMINELLEPTLNYYKLSNGKTVQVSYRPTPNQSPVPFTAVDVSYVNPALKPQGGSFDSTGVAEPWTNAPDGVKQAIQKFVTKPRQGVAEGVSDLSYDAQSLITKLRRDVEEKRLRPTPEAVLAAARELAGDMEFAPQLLVKQVLGQGVAEAQTPEQEIERLKLRQNAEHGGASLKRQSDTQARIRELEKQIKDKKQDVTEAAPVNLDLWNRAKLVAESKFNVYPSKQASIYADKWYQQHGGTWINGQS